MKNSSLGQAWLVLLLSLAFGAALAGVQVGWGPIIEQNKRNKTYDQIPRLVHDVEAVDLTGKPAKLSGVKEATEEVPYDDGKSVAFKVFWQGKDPAGKVHLGWVIKGKGNGYADVIEVLIGLDRKAERITGLTVLFNNETPGLGNKITTEKFQDQFRGLDAAKPVGYEKSAPAPGSNRIQAISGATISSESVCNIVNQAVAGFRAQLPALNQKDH